MFVFRTRHGRIPEPDPAIEGQLVAHVRNVARGVNERGAVYPALEVCAPSGHFAGHVQPWGRTLTVVAFGLGLEAAGALEARLNEELATHRARSPGTYAFEGTATAFNPEVSRQLERVRVCRHAPESVAAGGGRIRFLNEKTGLYDDGVSFTPWMDDDEWVEVQKKLCTVLYDPLGVLSGWGHRTQRDGAELAYHFPSETRDFAMLGEGCETEVVRTGTDFKVAHSKGAVFAAPPKSKPAVRFPDEVWLDEVPERLDCGCKYVPGGRAYLTEVCDCAQRSSVRRMLCRRCSESREKNYATFDCSRRCASVGVPSAVRERRCLDRKLRPLFDGGRPVAKNVAAIGEGEYVCYSVDPLIRTQVAKLATALEAPARKVTLLVRSRD